LKRIVFVTFGSLGDVHPYIALALELKKRGHRPVIVTTDMHRGGIEAAGIEFAPMRPTSDQIGNPSELVRRLFHPTKGPEHLIRNLVMPHIRDAYEDLDRACAIADLVVTHPLSFAGRLVAEKRGLPWRSTVLAPMSLMSASDPPLFGAAPWLMWVRKLGVFPYRAIFSLLKHMVGKWEKPLHELRADLGLPPMGAYAQFEGQYSPEGNLALFSRVLAVPQRDWPRNTALCGFSRYDGIPPDAALKRELDNWLAAGPRPIVFTLGSSVSMYASDFFGIAIETARRLEHRALLITGQDPAQYDAAIAATRMPVGTFKVFPYLPHSAAFPHAAVNVHQGGVGTLAQALAAGRPQLVTPVAFDQPDNARRTFSLGLARTLEFQKLTVDEMTTALRELLVSDSYATRAAAVARTIAEEDEARLAADLLTT